MKRLLLLPLLLGLTSPAQAGVDPEVHKMCLQAKDYLGCVKAQTDQGIESNMSIDLNNIMNTGNVCPKGWGYIGGGYCQMVWCTDAFAHDPRLRGKAWVCRGRRGSIQGHKSTGLFDNSLKFIGNSARATTDKKCPLIEPEIGRNNSCQNGLSEKELFESEDPLVRMYHPNQKVKINKKDSPAGINCDSAVWRNKPQCIDD